MTHLLQFIDPLFVVCGVLAGGLVGFTGVGGGSVMTPLLILVFGVSPAIAVGTDLIYASITNAGGSLAHGYNRNVDWKIVGLLALGSVPMTALTILLLYELGIDSHFAQGLITKVLGAALLITAILLLLRKPIMRLYDRRVGTLDSRHVARATILAGAVLGVLVTISSVGAGAIGVTVLVLLYPKLAPQRIVGTDIVHAVPLTLIAGLGHSLLGTIDLHILVSLLCGSIPAIIVASIASARTSETAVRVALACVLLLVCAKFWFVG